MVALPLSTLAAYKLVTTGTTVTESDKTYESADWSAALQVTGTLGAVYSGTNLTLSSTWTGRVPTQYGAFITHTVTVSLYDSTITAVSDGVSSWGGATINLNNVDIHVTGNNGAGVRMSTGNLSLVDVKIQADGLSWGTGLALTGGCSFTARRFYGA
jgi:hypothetical protein